MRKTSPRFLLIVVLLLLRPLTAYGETVEGASGGKQPDQTAEQFEEPYAVSLFAGNVVGFDVSQSKDIKGTATAGTSSAQATTISRTTY